ncbi:MAG: STT3 domain-containing protein [Candidatus Nanoarchaeia archaeon]|nr:STT3 domain-containing protein [Candidatus Nanoarchaeia archaeon]
MTEENESKEVLEVRKKEIFEKFKKHQNWIIYGILIILIVFGFYVRILNMPLTIDATTGNYVTIDLDPHAFLRYARYLNENGNLMSVDYMRNFPLGFPNLVEFSLLTHFMVYLYKFLDFFNPDLTLEYAVNIYPPIAFGIGLIFFFLLMKKLFNTKLAIIASAFLTVIPTFLYKGMFGSSDKEGLATVFMFMAFYFYFVGFKSKENWKVVLFGVLAGISTGLMSRVWGGVNIVYMIMGLFMIVSLLFLKFNKKDFFLYSAWFIAMLPIVTLGKYSLYSLLVSFTSAIAFLAFFMGILYYIIYDVKLIKIKESLINKIPRGFFVAILSIVLLVLAASVLVDPLFIINKPHALVHEIVNPLVDRWSKTVAESHESFFIDLISNYGTVMTIIFMLGSVLLFWNMVKNLKSRKQLTGAYTLFIVLFAFYKYSSSSKYLNGHSNVAILMLVGSVLLFLGILIYGYLKLFKYNKEEFEKVLDIPKINLFVLIWFIITLLAALRAVRLIHLFSLIACVLIAYFAYEGIILLMKLKNKTYKIIGVIIIILLLLNSFVTYTKADISVAKVTAPIYNKQWQYGMQWVRENTPKDAVFAHWWDYGYWVQTGGQRATITDGGNAIGSWNHFMGRHVITGQNDQEALEFLYVHNASYLLMIDDEIGKYPAFSSIGSDKDLDRYTQIAPFLVDRTKTQETQNQTIYVYLGGTMLDEDFILNDVLFPRFNAGIGGFLVPIDIENETVNFPEAPIAAVIYNGKQYNIPVNCVYFEGKRYEFDVNPTIGGCLRFIPKIDNNTSDRIGTILYMSDKVMKGNFGRLYLFEEETPAFELVYNDESLGIPLAYYMGNIIGPLKIWKIHYPDGFSVSENLTKLYLGNEFPEGVQ